jgi:hypothetical protein
MSPRPLLAVAGLVAFFCSGVQAATISAASSIEEMQAMAPGGAVLLLSYHAGMNRGGGLFTWNAASTTAADNCVVFPGKAASGRWIRRLSGPLDATMCGA